MCFRFNFFIIFAIGYMVFFHRLHIYRVKVLQCLYENPKRIDSVSVFEQQWYCFFVLG